MERSAERPYERLKFWRERDLWLIGGVFALGFALRLVFTSGFDGLYGQDAYAYYNYAQTLTHGGDLTPFFWPLGYPALLASGFALFGASAATAQVITLLLGGLIAPLVYLLARQIGAGRPGALAAGLIAALCGQAIQSSIVVMADIPALAWATLSAVALLRYLRADRLRWLVAAALLLALACVTRWLYLALIPAWSTALVLTWQRIRWRETLIAAMAAALVLLPQIAVTIGSPFPVLDHAWVAGWSPLNAFAREFANIDGHFTYDQINALFYARPLYDPYYLAPLFAPFVIVGAWYLRREPAQLALLLGWALLPYLFLAGIPYQNIRFPLIAVPALAVLAGYGLEVILIRRRAVFAGILVGGLALTAFAQKPVIDQFVAHQNADKAAVHWAVAAVPANSRLYTFELTLPLRAYAPCEVRELFDETPQTITADMQDGMPSYLFVNVWVIENTWAGRGIDVTYRWLHDTVGLEYLDRTGNYLLFRIANEDRATAAGV